jgi:hypothetical protein
MTKLVFDLSNFENLPEWFKEELSKMVISDLYRIAEKNMREEKRPDEEVETAEDT